MDTIVILWTANTERFANVETGLNTTHAELMASVKANQAEISPSTIFAMASILEGVNYFEFHQIYY